MKICSAPSSRAHAIVSSPTGPAPKMATLEPFSIWAFLAACQAVGRISERNRALSSDSSWGTLNGPTLPFGTRTYSAWPPGTPPYEVAVAKERGRCGDLFLVQRRALPGVGFFTGRKLVDTAEEAVPAGYHEGNNHPLRPFAAPSTSRPHSTIPHNSWPKISPCSTFGILPR